MMITLVKIVVAKLIYMKKLVLTITEDEEGYMDVELDLGGYNTFEALDIIKEVQQGLMEEQIRLN